MPSAKLQKKNKSITPSAKLQKKNQSRRPSSKVQPDHAAVILSQDRGQPDAIVVSQNKDKPEDLLDNLSKAEPDTLVVSQSRSQPAHAPDGGWRAWLQVLGSFIIFCITWSAPLQTRRCNSTDHFSPGASFFPLVPSNLITSSFSLKTIPPPQYHGLGLCKVS